MLVLEAGNTCSTNGLIGCTEHDPSESSPSQVTSELLSVTVKLLSVMEKTVSFPFGCLLVFAMI